MAYFVITKTLLFIDGVQKNVNVDVDEYPSDVDAGVQLKLTAERAVFGKPTATLVKYITIGDPAKTPVRLDYVYTKDDGKYRYEITMRVAKELA